MPISTRHGFRQALHQRQRLGQRGQAAVHLLGLSFEDAEAMIEHEALGNPVLQPVIRRTSTPICDIIANTVAEQVSLADHLLRQAGELTDLAPRVRARLRHLIGCLDERGYLQDRPEWVDDDEGAEALRALRALDPAGVGAFDLLDCFTLQLQRTGRWSGLWRALFDRADLIEKQDFAALARQLGVERAELRSMLAALRSLTAAPGCAFSAAAPPAPPDLLVRTLATGELVVELTRERQVRVSVSRDAVAALRRIEHQPEHAAYVKGQLAHARWVRHICRQRGDTLLKVARYAVALQHGAVQDGPAHLRPLTLRAAAAALDLHESTVSRAVAHKSIETPGGVIALRALFSAPSGEGASCVTAVRSSIQRLVAAEGAERVLSDQDIADRLAPEGVVLSRRSVAKHRAAMGLASARLRRRRLALFDDA